MVKDVCAGRLHEGDVAQLDVTVFYADTSGQKQPKVQYQFGVAIAAGRRTMARHENIDEVHR